MDRILALDVGRKRIGLAFSAGGHAPLGLDPIVRTGLRADLARLARVAAERRVRRFVVGLPLTLGGAESDMTRLVRAFALRLEQETNIPVAFQDERLTSVEAEQRLKDTGMSLKRMLAAKRKGAVDRIAATLILEDFLRGTGCGL